MKNNITMKKYILSMTAAIMALVVTSCQNEGSYYHLSELIYPTAYQPGIIYADQYEDSVKFNCTDIFKVAPKETSWISVDADVATGAIQYSYLVGWEVKVPLNIEQNITGTTRTGYVTVRTYGDDWDRTLTASYMQLPWINIMVPAADITYEEEPPYLPVSAVFSAEYAANETSGTIVFEASGESWTLTGGTFVHYTEDTGIKGKQTIALTLDANESTEERTDVLTLTSGGISNTITIKQLGKEPES